MKPITRDERFLARAAGESTPALQPITRREHFLARAAGDPGLELEPVTREEHFLQNIIDHGGGPTPTGTISITENGRYNVAEFAEAEVQVAGDIPERSAWYRPPDWPDYSQIDTSEFVKRPGLDEQHHYCKCYFTCFTKHPTIHTFSTGAIVYSALLGHIENGVFVTDKNITDRLPYTFEADDPEYSCIFIDGYGYLNHRTLNFKGPIVEAFGYFDFNKVFNSGNAYISASTIEAMTLWGELELGGAGASIYLQNLKYIDLTHASSMTITGRFYEGSAFQGFRTLAVCKLPDGIQRSVDEAWCPYSMFQNCTSLGEINLKNMDYAGVTTFRNNFDGCSSLLSINLDGVDMSSVKNMSGAFTKCSALEKISLVGTQLPGVAMSFSDSPLLTVETLNAIIAALPTVESAVTLTIGATNKAKLTDGEIAAATGKGWTVA